MIRIAGFRLAAALAAIVSISGCAVFDPLPTPGTRSEDGKQAALCPVHVGDSTFVGGADAAVNCLDAWRAAYYGALKDHIRFRASQELLIGGLSAKALYDGITEAGNGHHIAALGTGAALLYGNMVRRSPNPKLEVYAAGLQALSCAAIQARPLLMTQREHDSLKNIIELQAAQLGALSGALALEAHLGKSTAAHIDARNVLNLMQSDLDKAATVRDRLTTSGAEIEAQVGRIVANVTEALRSTEPDPASITDLIKSYKALAGTFAHGYLPSGSGGAGTDGGAGLTRRGAGEDEEQGGDDSAPRPVTCADKWVAEDKNDLPGSATPTSVGDALYCAHRGSYELRIRMASVAAIEQVTASIEGCGKPEDLKPARTISLQPDVNRIDLKTGGSYTLGVRSAGGIPAVHLYGNGAGALEDLEIDASLGYLVVQLKSTDKVTPSPVVLAVTAPNGDTRQVEIVVSNPQPAAAAAPDANNGATPRAPVSSSSMGLQPGEESLATGDRIRTLQCMLGMPPSEQFPNIGPKTRARIRIANEVFGLSDRGDRWSEQLDQDLEEQALNCHARAVPEEELAGALGEAP